MSELATTASEVFSLAEVAEAAGVSAAAVAQLVENGGVRTAAGGYLAAEDAVVCVRALRRLARTQTHDLFANDSTAHGSPIAGIAGSSVLHLCLAGIFALAATVGVDQVSRSAQRLEAARLVFLATPGPGGGGGGGGLEQPAPPPKAEMKLPVARVKSPVPRPKPLSTQRPERLVSKPAPAVVPDAKPRPAEPLPPPPQPALAPQVVAPVATASTDPRDRAGVLSETPAASDSQGSGSGGGVGTGQGTGIGEGTGAGVGPGSGGGTGGGPYRPGAGISPPAVIHEVRPDYTDDARRQGIEGEVVLEIVVRRDGTVGDVRVLEGLRGGLDRRAIEAVRQWRFSPARRYGTPVDVIVEVAVEFKLR